MSRDAGKTRTAAKWQPGKKAGRRQLELEVQEPLILNERAEALAASKDHHAQLLTRDESSDIRYGVEQLAMEAEKLRELSSNPYKSRPRQLDTVHEHSPYEQRDSSEGEDEIDSRLGSLDTQPYSEQVNSSPAIPYNLGVSPLITGQSIPIANPQMINAPPTTSPGVPTVPLDPMTLIQNMFAQQAEATKQQAQVNQQFQLLLANSLDKQIEQQSMQLQRQAKVVARQAITDARSSVKPMTEGVDICQYLDHFEAEMIEANIPLNKWKGILISKLSVKTEKTCAHLAHNSESTYAEIKKHLLRHVGPSADELCNLVHGAAHAEFRDKTETQKLQHCKYIAERYFLGIPKPGEAIIHHMAIRMYKFHSNKRFAHSIKLNKAQTLAELLELTSSFDSQLDYERTKFDRPNSTHYRSDKPNNNYNKPFRKTIFCEYCRKTGHQESDCFKKQNVSRQEPGQQQKHKYTTQDSNTQNSYSKNNKQLKEVGIKSRLATVNWSHTNTTVDSIKGLVNGHTADIILDTGAQVTVVPGKFV